MDVHLACGREFLRKAIKKSSSLVISANFRSHIQQVVSRTRVHVTISNYVNQVIQALSLIQVMNSHYQVFETFWALVFSPCISQFDDFSGFRDEGSLGFTKASSFYLAAVDLHDCQRC